MDGWMARTPLTMTLLPSCIVAISVLLEFALLCSMGRAGAKRKFPLLHILIFSVSNVTVNGVDNEIYDTDSNHQCIGDVIDCNESMQQKTDAMHETRQGSNSILSNPSSYCNQCQTSSIDSSTTKISSPPSLHKFYHQGMSAQAYKPNAPKKSQVCQVPEPSKQASKKSIHRVANWASWRSNYYSVVPIKIRGNIYRCDSSHCPDTPLAPTYDALTSNNAATIEVWQARPDGTYSSLRPEIEDGDCRATIPLNFVQKGPESPFSFHQMEFQTLAPGSTGLLGGLVPSYFWGELPMYGPGVISFYLDLEGYIPILSQLSMSDVSDWLRKNKSGADTDVIKRFQYSGFDMRPHVWRENRGKLSDGSLGKMEIKSVRQSSGDGYDLTVEVNADFFVFPMDGYVPSSEKPKSSLKERFCSSPYGYFSWLSSFFKEPIAVCFPSLLDFFAL